jgi:polyphosphate glucokinase
MTAGQIGRRVRGDRRLDLRRGGTSLGSALITDGILERTELAHLPYKKGRTYEDYVGKAGLKRLGKKKWRRHVLDVVARLTAALESDDVVIGGGNAKWLKRLPRGVPLGANTNAFVGGYRLWRQHA